jgi:hypothetical protein
MREQAKAGGNHTNPSIRLTQTTPRGKWKEIEINSDTDTVIRRCNLPLTN